METIDIADAELHLEQLIDEVEQGKSFVISQNGVSLARLVTIQKARVPGLLKGKIWVADDFDSPIMEQLTN